jgi:hypothetical protein
MQRLDQDVRPARAPDSIVVLEEAPEQPYTVIARIDDLRAKIVDEAAQVGGEAVIVGPESKETVFLILPTGMFPNEQKKLAGEVIVFR